MKRGWHQVAGRVEPARRTVDGQVLDSMGEAGRLAQLKLLERSGAISNLRCQVRFPLVLPDGTPILLKSPRCPGGRRCHYTADFAYTENDKEVIEEYKGFDEPLARLRRAIVEAIYGIEIRMSGPQARAKRRKHKLAGSDSVCLTQPNGPKLAPGRRG
jgi:hypothetical protein